MRTVSQIFADFVKEGQDNKAKIILKEHGPRRTGALMWLAMQKEVSVDWVDTLNQMNIKEDDAGKALLLVLADNNNFFKKEEYISFLSQKLSLEWFNKNDPIHHASFHGNFNSFGILEGRHKELSNTDFNWNKKNTEGHTPLYLSLTETHLNSTVEILKKGGSPYEKMENSLDPKKTSTVLSQVFHKKSGVLGYVKQVWEAANDKAAIQKSLDGILKTEKKSRKKKKM